MTDELHEYIERTVRVPAALDRRIADLAQDLGSDADWSAAAVLCLTAGWGVVAPDEPVRRSDVIRAVNALPTWTDSDRSDR
jgi:hypothetical protein